MTRLAWPAAVAALLVSPDSAAVAQGIASAGIRGSVRAAGAATVDGARVRVTHTATGFATELEVRRGRFLIQGLESGGPYTVTVRRLGFVAQRREGLLLRLGELLELNLVLQPLIVQLESVSVVATDGSFGPAHAHGGTAATIEESLLHHLPTLNRDLYDFVRLVPQISTKVGVPNGGFSAGGVGFRFNNFLINGVSDRTTSTSVSNPSTGAKSMSLDAVREYQVLLAPYDVRYGDFAGALVNAVTKSGANALRGSVFAYGRNDQLSRRTADSGRTAYDRIQYGFSLGGPIVRDRLHFFIAPELQHFTYPAAGPYVGQPRNATRAVPVQETDLARLNEIMRRNYGLTAGSAGPVENGNPLRNVFSRLDLALPAWNSRVVAWSNYSGSDEIALSRISPDTFSLSTNQVTRVSSSWLSAIQMHTTLARAGGGHNELLLSHRTASVHPVASVRQSIVRVSVPGTSGGHVTINTGTHETGQETWIRSSAIGLKDNLTLPVGTSHVLTFGAELEWFGVRRGGVPGSYGAWTFASLNDLELGVVDQYEVGLDLGGGSAPLGGAQYAAYVSDQWQAQRRLSVTAGLRADLLAVDGRPPYDHGVDSIFGRRTDQMPRRRIELAPRVGFVWDLSGTRKHRVRGGAGIFTARYPLAWAQTALSSYGAGLALLRCGRGGRGASPSFTPDYRAPPRACADAVTIARGDVDLLDRNLRMMRTVRGSLAYDGSLPGGFRFTGEALVTRALSDFVFVNLNLQDPVATDRNGRVMYGAISPSGMALPNRRSDFLEVIDLRNTSRGHSYQFATRLESELTDRTTGAISYTYSRVRDAATPLRVNTRGTNVWAGARALSGRDDDFAPGISSNDVPHRVVLAGGYALPWLRGTTDLSFYYVGESGRPFTYVAWSSLRLGDLNADGSNTNDPIYVPRSAFDTRAIRFDATGDLVQPQQAALERLIQRTPCLRGQRGRILERNSCREPWSNTTIASVRQSMPFGRRTVETQLDVFNVLNLLNSRWGLHRQAIPRLLEHVGQDPVRTEQPIFHFGPTAPRWTTAAVESAFQLQLALRYGF